MCASSGWAVALELGAPKRSTAVYRQGARFSGDIWSFGLGSPSLNLLSLFSAQHSSLGTAGDTHSLDKPYSRGQKFGRLELRSQKGGLGHPVATGTNVRLDRLLSHVAFVSILKTNLIFFGQL